MLALHAISRERAACELKANSYHPHVQPAMADSVRCVPTYGCDDLSRARVELAEAGILLRDANPASAGLHYERAGGFDRGPLAHRSGRRREVTRFPIRCGRVGAEARRPRYLLTSCTTS